jgi:hypothetical protein
MQMAWDEHKQAFVECAIIENSIHDANTPDIGIHIAYHRVFGW